MPLEIKQLQLEAKTFVDCVPVSLIVSPVSHGNRYKSEA